MSLSPHFFKNIAERNGVVCQFSASCEYFMFLPFFFFCFLNVFSTVKNVTIYFEMYLFLLKTLLFICKLLLAFFW